MYKSLLLIIDISFLILPNWICGSNVKISAIYLVFKVFLVVKMLSGRIMLKGN